MHNKLHIVVIIIVMAIYFVACERTTPLATNQSIGYENPKVVQVSTVAMSRPSLLTGSLVYNGAGQWSLADQEPGSPLFTASVVLYPLSEKTTTFLTTRQTERLRHIADIRIKLRNATIPEIATSYRQELSMYEDKLYSYVGDDGALGKMAEIAVLAAESDPRRYIFIAHNKHIGYDMAIMVTVSESLRHNLVVSNVMKMVQQLGHIDKVKQDTMPHEQVDVLGPDGSVQGETLRRFGSSGVFLKQH